MNIYIKFNLLLLCIISFNTYTMHYYDKILQRPLLVLSIASIPAIFSGVLFLNELRVRLVSGALFAPAGSSINPYIRFHFLPFIPLLAATGIIAANKFSNR